MAKSKKSGTEVMLDITSRLPWWMGVGLALGSYLLLHAVAGKQLAAPAQAGQLTSFASVAMVQALARIGQYLLPSFFLLGAAVSAYRRGKSAQLHSEAAHRADVVATMSWREFEVLVGEYFRRQGYVVIDNGGGGPDGGVDVWLQKGSDRYLVQCKQWRARRVGVQTVRELYGVISAKRVAGGFVVTSGDFTEDACRFADGREVQLINGRELQTTIRAQARNMSRAIRPAVADSVTAVTSATPTCPLCSAPMVMRLARNGPLAGKNFWGCSSFAQANCRGTEGVQNFV